MVPIWLMGYPHVYNCALKTADMLSLIVCSVCVVDIFGLTISVSLVFMYLPCLSVLSYLLVLPIGWEYSLSLAVSPALTTGI